MALGVIAGAATVLALGAAVRQTHTITNEFEPLEFRVLAVTRHGEPRDGKQDTVLRLAPNHLHSKSLKKYEEFCAQQGETRELTVIPRVDSSFQIPTNWILSLRASDIGEPYFGAREITRPQKP